MHTYFILWIIVQYYDIYSVTPGVPPLVKRSPFLGLLCHCDIVLSFVSEYFLAYWDKNALISVCIFLAPTLK